MFGAIAGAVLVLGGGGAFVYLRSKRVESDDGKFAHSFDSTEPPKQVEMMDNPGKDKLTELSLISKSGQPRGSRL